MTLGIAELADVCARMRALNLDLFTELGSWAATSPGGAAQRWYATACHRHAWHAELWEQRAPVIPEHDLDEATATHRSRRLPEQPDEHVYRDHLVSITAELEALLERVDGDLDPSTRRTMTLVRNDLAELGRP